MVAMAATSPPWLVRAASTIPSSIARSGRERPVATTSSSATDRDRSSQANADAAAITCCG